MLVTLSFHVFSYIVLCFYYYINVKHICTTSMYEMRDLPRLALLQCGVLTYQADSPLLVSQQVTRGVG